jgi:hypothetical protein
VDRPVDVVSNIETVCGRGTRLNVKGPLKHMGGAIGRVNCVRTKVIGSRYQVIPSGKRSRRGQAGQT